MGAGPRSRQTDRAVPQLPLPNIQARIALPGRQAVPATAAAVTDLVRPSLQRRVWNEVVASERPLHVVMQVGSRRRSLIEPDDGLLGPSASQRGCGGRRPRPLDRWEGVT